MHTKLSVNINKIATLRNARGGNLPDLLQVAKDCERFGAEGITVHPRPDERHIRFDDVRNLKKIIATGLNIEGFPNERFLNLIEEVQPEQCTLVPDAEHVITSNEGWDIKTHEKYLAKIVAQIKKNSTARVSVFINPDVAQIEFAKKIGADRIEIYTGDFAHQFHTADKQQLILPYSKCAAEADLQDVGVNAGHDLNLENGSSLFQIMIKILLKFLL